MKGKRIVIFTCNWNAHGALEAAGRAHLSLPAGVRPLRVTCLGQVSTGMILCAFEKGAQGVLLLGCPPGECHYGFGSRCVEGSFAEARRLAVLLGIRDGQLCLDSVAFGGGEGFVEKVRNFVEGLGGLEGAQAR